MTIRYENRFRDIMAFNLYHVSHAPVFIGLFCLSLAAFSYTFSQAIPNELKGGARLGAFLLAGLTALVSVAVLLFLPALLGQISHRNRTLLTEHAINLGENSFAVQDKFFNSELQWHVVQKLARILRYIFIYLAQHMALVNPRMAFASQSGWDASYEICHRITGTGAA